MEMRRGRQIDKRLEMINRVNYWSSTCGPDAVGL